MRFKEFSPWEVYRWWIIGAFSFICLVMLLVSLHVNNILGRRRAESCLALSEANLRRAQKVAAIGSLRINVEKIADSWSARTNEIFGLPPDSVLTYEAFMQAVHPDDREEVKERWSAALRDEPYDVEHRIQVGDQEKWIRSNLKVEFDQHGKPHTATGIVQDVTGRKQAEEQSSRLRQELAHVTRVATVGGLAQGLSPFTPLAIASSTDGAITSSVVLLSSMDSSENLITGIQTPQALFRTGWFSRRQ